jgi:hypothetical protein
MNELAKQVNTMLTTIDNPFDPFEDFTSWFDYDSRNGYNSCGLLALFAETSKLYSEDENNDLIDEAIDEIINADPLHIYTKITKEVDDGE